MPKHTLAPVVVENEDLSRYMTGKPTTKGIFDDFANGDLSATLTEEQANRILGRTMDRAQPTQ